MKKYPLILFFLILSIALYKIGGWEFKTNYDIKKKYLKVHKLPYGLSYGDLPFEIKQKLDKPIFINDSHYMIKFNNKYAGLLNKHTFFKSPVLEFILLIGAVFSFEQFIGLLFGDEDKEKNK